jgi:hypothetical protein
MYMRAIPFGVQGTVALVGFLNNGTFRLPCLFLNVHFSDFRYHLLSFSLTMDT